MTCPTVPWMRTATCPLRWTSLCIGLTRWKPARVTSDRHLNLHVLFFIQPQTKFTRGIFHLTNADVADAHWGEEKLDFVDFMSAMVTFALFGDRELLQYCFYIFDVDNSGAISRNELRDLIAGVRKYDATDGNSPKIEEYLEKLHASLDADGDGFINFTEFTHMNTIMPSVLSPAKSMQLKIQLRLFGSEFWVKRQRELMGYRGRKAMAAAQRAAASMLEHRTNRYNMVLQIRRGCCWCDLCEEPAGWCGQFRSCVCCCRKCPKYRPRCTEDCCVGTPEFSCCR
jgi:Ca2+-binding EF-hand superfamily protein